MWVLGAAVIAAVMIAIRKINKPDKNLGFPVSRKMNERSREGTNEKKRSAYGNQMGGVAR